MFGDYCGEFDNIGGGDQELMRFGGWMRGFEGFLRGCCEALDDDGLEGFGGHDVRSFISDEKMGGCTSGEGIGFWKVS